MVTEENASLISKDYHSDSWWWAASGINHRPQPHWTLSRRIPVGIKWAHLSFAQSSWDTPIRVSHSFLTTLVIPGVLIQLHLVLSGPPRCRDNRHETYISYPDFLPLPGWYQFYPNSHFPNFCPQTAIRTWSMLRITGLSPHHLPIYPTSREESPRGGFRSVESYLVREYWEYEDIQKPQEEGHPTTGTTGQPFKIFPLTGQSDWFFFPWIPPLPSSFFWDSNWG